MNPEELTEVKARISAIEDELAELKSLITAHQIDSQVYVKSNPKITPGVATKIAYDANGLVVDSMSLSADDIPTVPMSKVKDLSSIIESTSEYLTQLKAGFELLQESSKVGIPAETGIKINYDKNGRVVSSTSLLPEDIPELPISKISDLSSILESLHTPTVVEDNSPKTKAGIYTKVQIDSSGNVVAGLKLTSEDIPSDIVSKVNTIESSLTTLASQQRVDQLFTVVGHKLDANPYITPGRYTKVIVDSKGLVICGTALLKSDLPSLGVEDIAGLSALIRSKADQSAFVELQNTISTLISTTTSSSPKTVESKSAEIADVRNDVSRLNNTINSIAKSSNAELQTTLKMIQGDISALSARVAILEHQLSEESS